MYKKMIIVIFFSLIYSINEKIDIRLSTLDELSVLPIDTEKIISIKQYLKVQDINSIYDLLYIDNIDIKDIHQIRPFIKISYNDGDKIIDYQYNPFTNESNRSSIPTKALPYNKIYNVNDITYDQLS